MSGLDPLVGRTPKLSPIAAAQSLSLDRASRGSGGGVRLAPRETLSWPGFVSLGTRLWHFLGLKIKSTWTPKLTNGGVLLHVDR